MSPTRKAAVLSIATSLATLALKFGAWFVTGSVSLLSDALEAFVNLAAGLIALAALTIAESPADDRHAYGHDKAEYFASGVEGTLILVAAASIIAAAWSRFASPAPLENLGPGLAIAALAAGMNFATSTFMMKVARAHDSITIEADAKHLMTDVWTSAGVIGALLVVMFVPQWQWLDPVIAVAVGLHIIVTGVHLLRRSVDGLMDASLAAEEVGAVEAAIRANLPKDASFHDLRTRKSGSRKFVELHLALPGAMTVTESHAVCDRIEAAIVAAASRTEVTVHVEPSETHAVAVAT
jgi:cation diffusion facilitator family transporter